jgi:hypothetical protein
VTIKTATLGLGLTFLDLNLDNLPDLLKFVQISIFLNGVEMCALKVGIGLSLLRLRLSKVFNWAVIGCIIVSLLVNLIVFPGFFAQCRPMARLWDKSIPGTCWDENASLAFSYTQTGTLYRLICLLGPLLTLHVVGNILTDFAFTFGPLYVSCSPFSSRSTPSADISIVPGKRQGVHVQQVGVAWCLWHRYDVRTAYLCLSFPQSSPN